MATTSAVNGARRDPQEDAAGVRAVILAGGRGTRLAPYTSVLPKPLMPVGDRSILELVVDQLTAVGVTDFTFCVGHLSHLIETVFDHRNPVGATISYARESHPLGTAGPLRLIERPAATFVVMNGDVLSDLPYGDLIRHHRASGSIVTIATYEQVIKIEYGIIHTKNEARVHAYEEKPQIVSNVSMGVYVLEPEAIDHIPADGAFDFPDLVKRLLEVGETVGCYRHDGVWFDIGNHADYIRAVEMWEQLQHREPLPLPAGSRSKTARPRADGNGASSPLRRRGKRTSSALGTGPGR